MHHMGYRFIQLARGTWITVALQVLPLLNSKVLLLSQEATVHPFKGLQKQEHQTSLDCIASIEEFVLSQGVQDKDWRDGTEGMHDFSAESDPALLAGSTVLALDVDLLSVLVVLQLWGSLDLADLFVLLAQATRL